MPRVRTVNRWGRVVVAVVLATPFVAASKVSADGEPVTSFGVNGVMIDSALSGGRQVYISDALQLQDGSFVAAGDLLPWSSDNWSTAFLVKYLPSGARDSGFGTGGVVWGIRADHMAAFDDGRLLIWYSGSATHGSGSSIVSPSGALLPGPDLGAGVTQLLSRADGSIVAVGAFFSLPSRLDVARIVYPSGSIDNLFDASVDRLLPHPTPQVAPPMSASSATLTSDGRLIVSISSSPTFPLPSSGNCTLVAFNPGGGIDESFGSGGAVVTPAGRCTIDKFIDDDTIRVLPHVAGASTFLYSPDGALLATLTAPFDNPLLAMAGTGYTYAPLGQSSVVSYDPVGNVDTTFGLNGVADLTGMRIDRVNVLSSGDLLAIGSGDINLNTVALGLIHASYGTALQPPAIDTTKFVAVPPKRILDTRDGTGAPIGKIGVGGTIDLQITGVPGVPANDLSAVVLNVTATDATQAGFVTVYPSGTRRPWASNLNLDTVGQTAANLVTVKVGTNGKVSMFSSGGTHLVADVAGYYTPALTSTDGRLQTATQERILDTRLGLGAPAARPTAGQQIDLQVTGRGPVPATGVSAVVLNVTGDQAAVDGFVTAWPTGIDRPVVSNLNLVTGETRANLVVVPVSSDGKVSLFTSGGTDLIADVAGWFTDATAADDSVGLFVPITPTRVFDTRQEPTAPTAPVSSLTRLIGSTTVVPPGASIAVAANITVTQSGGPGFVTAWPAHTPQPLVSNLNTSHAGQTIPNSAIVPLGQDELALYTQSGAHLIVDINGWYTNF